MKQTDPHFKLRIPPALKDRVAEAAKAANRSMNAEIVSRLSESFEDKNSELEFIGNDGLIKTITASIKQSLTKYLLEEHRRLDAEWERLDSERNALVHGRAEKDRTK